MDLLLLFIRLILAALLITAGIAKFADLKGAEKAARGFGVSGVLARLGPVVLSAAEIVLGIALVFTSVSWFGAIGAAFLLVSFIVMMGYQFAKGNAPDCHCFGQLHSEPVGLKSIVRNVIFLALASVLLYRGPRAQGLAVAEITAVMMPTIFGGLAVIMLGGALFYLRKIIQLQKDLSQRLDQLESVSPTQAGIDHDQLTDPYQGLPIGSPLPDFEMLALDSKPVTLTNLLARARPLLFFFVSPNCEPCQALLPEFIKWRRELSDRVDLVFVTSGSVNDNRTKFGDLGDALILLDEGRRFAISVGGRWTPTALYVDANGKIASQIVAGDIAIGELVEKIRRADLAKPYTYFANGNDHGRGLKVGKQVPEFVLSDLDGQQVSRRDLIGKQTLVTFWSPTCPHCSAILDELKAWERSRHNGDPQLIVFSDGDEDEHRSLGLASRVIIDKGYKTAGKLGMSGTPSAVLIDENGVIATETGVGANNIWALIGKYE